MNIDDWACEAALWMRWMHRGSMRARMQSRLLILDAEEFQKNAAQSPSLLPYPRRYALEFAKHLARTPELDLTDLEDPVMDVEFMAQMTREEPNQDRCTRVV